MVLQPTRVSNRNSVKRAMIISACAISLRYNCEQGSNLSFAELLFHLKINNLNCDLQVYAADTSMKISL